jgi:hypothetical protein
MMEKIHLSWLAGKILKYTILGKLQLQIVKKIKFQKNLILKNQKYKKLNKDPR